MRAFVLEGPDAAEALDWLHVHAALDGVLEGDDGTITVWLRGELPELPFAALASRELPIAAADWTITGLEQDAPILVADDLLVRPPWVERPAGFAGVELIVPRGAAFGSGEHGSTQAALRLLHRHWVAAASFGDVGTGSGILALYAAVRGCSRIAACDIDGPSVDAARELLPDAAIHLGGPERMAPSDCLVANMTATELHASFPAILAAWTGRGWLVLGGLREGEVEGIAARLPTPPIDRETVGAFTALVVAPRG